jgi:hypothetical protein
MYCEQTDGEGNMLRSVSRLTVKGICYVLWADWLWREYVTYCEQTGCEGKAGLVQYCSYRTLSFYQRVNMYNQNI